MKTLALQAAAAALVAALGTTAVHAGPVAAAADRQDNRADRRDDRQDNRTERRDDKQDNRADRRDDRQENRGDRREDRQERRN